MNKPPAATFEPNTKENKAMKKSALALVAVLALGLTGCASTPEATSDTNVVESVEDAANVATDAISKAVVKDTIKDLIAIGNSAATLIENKVAAAK